MRRSIAAALVLGALASAISEAQERAEPDPRLERALELERELRELLRELPPELRSEFERLAGKESSPAETKSPVAVPAPAPDSSESRSVPPAASEESIAEPAPPRCATLDVLDSNRDGLVSGIDRYWRYLALWKDDGDGRLEESEVRSLFRHGIRRISVRLTSYTTAKDADGAVWVEEFIELDLLGRKGQGVLVMEAGDLARGDELWLEDAAGERLTGYQPLGRGIYWGASGRPPVPVLCR